VLLRSGWKKIPFFTIASGIKKHYDTTLERVKDYYGIVFSRIKKDY
jgi:hypothetical protein